MNLRSQDRVLDMTKISYSNTMDLRVSATCALLHTGFHCRLSAWERPLPGEKGRSPR